MIHDPAIILDLNVRKGTIKSRRFNKDDDIVKIARDFTGEALYTLLDLLDSDDMKLRLDAAKEILNRGWGRTKETIVHEESPKTVEELQAKITEVEKKIRETSL